MRDGRHKNAYHISTILEVRVLWSADPSSLLGIPLDKTIWRRPAMLLLPNPTSQTTQIYIHTSRISSCSCRKWKHQIAGVGAIGRREEMCVDSPNEACGESCLAIRASSTPVHGSRQPPWDRARNGIHTPRVMGDATAGISWAGTAHPRWCDRGSRC